MPDRTVRGYAVVTLTVEVRLSQPWPSGATIDEIRIKAKPEAIQALRQRLDAQANSDQRFSIREAKVGAVIVEEE